MKASAVITELKRLAAQNDGVLRPEDVVAAAVDNESPLHKYFQWDDTAAAHAYRLSQARALIRVSVQYVEGHKSEPVRVFVSLTPDRRESGYRLTTDVLSDQQMYQQLLRDAFAEMKSFQQKYKTLKELAEVFSAMRGAEHHVQLSLQPDGATAA